MSETPSETPKTPSETPSGTKTCENKPYTRGGTYTCKRYKTQLDFVDQTKNNDCVECLNNEHCEVNEYCKIENNVCTPFPTGNKWCTNDNTCESNMCEDNIDPYFKLNCLGKCASEPHLGASEPPLGSVPEVVVSKVVVPEVVVPKVPKVPKVVKVVKVVPEVVPKVVNANEEMAKTSPGL